MYAHRQPYEQSPIQVLLTVRVRFFTLFKKVFALLFPSRVPSKPHPRQRLLQRRPGRPAASRPRVQGPCQCGSGRGC